MKNILLKIRHQSVGVIGKLLKGIFYVLVLAGWGMIFIGIWSLGSTTISHLAGSNANVVPTPTPENPLDLPANKDNNPFLSNDELPGLLVTNKQMNATAGNSNPVFTGTLTNVTNKIYRNVSIRISFYRDYANDPSETADTRALFKPIPRTCSNPADDNEYVAETSYVGAYDSKIISVTVPTNFDTTKPYIFCATPVKVGQ